MRKPTLCRVRSYFGPGFPRPTRSRTTGYFLPFSGAFAAPAPPAGAPAAAAPGAAPAAPGAEPGAAVAGTAASPVPGTAAAGVAATSSFSGTATTAMVAFLMTLVLNVTPSGA